MNKLFTFPNILTLCRILFTPIFIFLFLSGEKYLLWSVIVFTIAAITDFYDGYFARYLKMKSKFGSFFDPLADKVLIIATFFTFYFAGIIDLWMVLIILFRDLFVTFLRIYLVKKDMPLQTSYLAKGKTVVQFVAIYLIFIFLFFKYWSSNQLLILILQRTVIIFMYFVVLFTLWSVFDYLFKNSSILKSKNGK